MAKYPEPVQFYPKNPDKYKGTIPIIARSKWEYDVFKRLDMHPHVKSWESESTIIPYISPVDSKKHRYFPDIKVEILKPDGSISVELVEIKPYSQTQPPVFKDSQRPTTKRKLAEDFAINQAKWESARAYCDKMGFTFSLLTEREIYGKKV